MSTPLQNQVLHQSAHRVVRQGGHHGRTPPEAAAQTACDVVLAATLPGLEGAGGADPSLARVQAEHHLAERHHVDHGVLLSVASAVSRRIPS